MYSRQRNIPLAVDDVVQISCVIAPVTDGFQTVQRPGNGSLPALFFMRNPLSVDVDAMEATCGGIAKGNATTGCMCIMYVRKMLGTFCA